MRLFDTNDERVEKVSSTRYIYVYILDPKSKTIKILLPKPHQNPVRIGPPCETVSCCCCWFLNMVL